MKTFPTIFPVTSHTKHVGPGSTFVAIQGFKEDGVSYIPEALKRGASLIVVQKEVALSEDLCLLIESYKAQISYVTSTRKALAELSAQAYEYPSKSLKMIGVTGTKGKTTTTYLLEHILRSAGLRTARLCTVKNRILASEYDAPLTTPQPDYLHTFLSLCKQSEVDVVIMEVAAQALSMQRVYGLEFESLVFTNFSLEHSEFYASMDDYFKAKCELFNYLATDYQIVLNADDEYVSRLAKNFPGALTISMKDDAAYKGVLKESTLTKLALDVMSPDGNYHLSSSNLLGEFSAYNILACCAIASGYGVSAESIQAALDTFQGVPGRLNSYALPNGALAIIDNAHTPSSFEAFFKAVRPLSNDIIVVFGAGGDRDALKRPIMGSLATSYADRVILTTDNPRTEDVKKITSDIFNGVDKSAQHKVEIEYDREQAIKKAYSYSQSGSLLVLLGKGLVEYQDVHEVKIPFSEAAILRSLRS